MEQKQQKQPKSGRKPISFTLADYEAIRAAAIANGFYVGAGNGSQLSLFVVIMTTGKKEQKSDE